MVIYLLHIQPPYKQARHYLGIASDLEARLQLHQKGRGARLTQVCVESGHELKLVRIWQGGRKEERRLKRQKTRRGFAPCAIPR